MNKIDIWYFFNFKINLSFIYLFLCFNNYLGFQITLLRFIYILQVYKPIFGLSRQTYIDVADQRKKTSTKLCRSAKQYWRTSTITGCWLLKKKKKGCCKIEKRLVNWMKRMVVTISSGNLCRSRKYCFPLVMGPLLKR